MRQVNTLSTVGTTNIALGEVEFIPRAHRVLIKAGDSVGTATLRVTFAGNEVFSGPLPIESGTDRIDWPGLLCCSFIAPRDGQLIAVLGGTVAGARVDFLVLSPGESVPF